jgi:hypothetical protein
MNPPPSKYRRDHPSEVPALVFFRPTPGTPPFRGAKRIPPRSYTPTTGVLLDVCLGFGPKMASLG